MKQKLAEPPVVVVTGASAGVGRAVVRRFAADKAKIGLIARGRDGLEGAKREVEAAGGEALICQCDVADYAAVEAAAERIEQELGPIDVWINAAFAGVPHSNQTESRIIDALRKAGALTLSLVALRRKAA